MAYHNLVHGGGRVTNPNQEMYPAAAVLPNTGMAQAAHKEPAMFSNTRLFDFSQKDQRRQAGLQQYLERATNEGNPLKTGDVIGACAIPEKCFLMGFAWGVENAEAGVTLKASIHFSGIDIVTIDGGTVDSGGLMFPTPQWMKTNDVIDLEVTAFPANGVTDLRFWVTPIVIVPKIGN